MTQFTNHQYSENIKNSEDLENSENLNLNNLNDWLVFLEKNLPQSTFDLSQNSLEKLKRMQQVLNLHPENRMTLITVGGTNGKGSTCAFLEHILKAAHYQTAVYSSPHLLNFNERLRIDGQNIQDEYLVKAFKIIQQTAADLGMHLSYFEFTTLACVYITCFLAPVNIDVLILEVGLGGRLDATNIFNPHAAIIASVDLDHQAYLGDTREAIAIEKAGIYRENAINIYAEENPPSTIIEIDTAKNFNIIYAGKDYQTQCEQQQWGYQLPALAKKLFSLPHPNLKGMHQLNNAAAAITALFYLSQNGQIGLASQDIKRGLVEAELPGRFQVLAGQPCIVQDVAHNAHAAKALAQNLDRMGFYANNYAIFSVLADKDLQTMLELLNPLVDEWHIATLDHPRALDVQMIAQGLEKFNNKNNNIKNNNINKKKPVYIYPSIAHAYQNALAKANKQQIDAQAISRLIVWGSFYTVEAVVKYQQTQVLPDVRIKSFAKRNGRLTERQAYALEHLREPIIAYQHKMLSTETWQAFFSKPQPIILEIGFGMGRTTIEIAKQNPDFNYIGVEVHEAGIGAILHDIADAGLTNLRVIAHDAVDVLINMMPDGLLAGVHIFFPDPWHKKKHNKRRIIQAEFVELLASKMHSNAYLHCATDWQPYAEWMLEVLTEAQNTKNILINQNVEQAYSDKGQRPLTKFENRGLKLGHGVYDLRFLKK